MIEWGKSEGVYLGLPKAAKEMLDSFVSQEQKNQRERCLKGEGHGNMVIKDGPLFFCGSCGVPIDTDVPRATNPPKSAK